MIRGKQSKHKICRRAGFCLWNKPTCPASRDRQHGPGEHGRQNYRRTDYHRILLEKQKLRYTYNITEKQFRRTFHEAKRMRGVTAENLIGLLESRLDSVVLRAGFAFSPFQARQLVSHGHFLLDGSKANIPSMRVKPGQTVAVREKSRGQEWAQIASERLGERPVPYISCDADAMSATLESVPGSQEVPIGAIDIQQTVSFYSRV